GRAGGCVRTLLRDCRRWIPHPGRRPAGRLRGDGRREGPSGQQRDGRRLSLSSREPTNRGGSSASALFRSCWMPAGPVRWPTARFPGCLLCTLHPLFCTGFPFPRLDILHSERGRSEMRLHRKPRPALPSALLVAAAVALVLGLVGGLLAGPALLPVNNASAAAGASAGAAAAASGAPAGSGESTSHGLVADSGGSGRHGVWPDEPEAVKAFSLKGAVPGTGGEPGANPVPDTGTASGAGEKAGAGQASGEDEQAGADGQPADREELLARWEELTLEQRRLLEELRAVHAEMRAVAEVLWSQEMDAARERVREQVNRYGAEYGEEILEWLPPRLLERISEATGWTPDQLRDMIREGAWGDIF